MRISKAQAQANRDRVLAAAAEMFRAHGFEGVSVGELMSAAGFTHGGFYNHFGSKEALAAEALSAAWTQMEAERARAADLAQLLDGYLSPAARGAPGRSCPAAALAGEVSRGPPAVRAAFAEGLERMIAEVEGGLSGESAERRSRAVALVSGMVGALMLSRAVPEASPLADELLAATRREAKRALL
ncbi:MAG: TetR/AcrR family transcriptional regulator [Phenylobacterium sp.]|uniref:TetR/AcrR family transcriptional regulator n=1 Tax=Phenylobacterium sp. TaxID=1871053 RepID=UPI001A642C5D|nr:TetR/AcrR family transcriptional regulator [Phenylobacterium sp.]MBL8771521.1 TetR/AcrR family transcriptional regulator [Phenylobacterium sp.]